MGNGEWGMGNGELGIGSSLRISLSLRPQLLPSQLFSPQSARKAGKSDDLRVRALGALLVWRKLRKSGRENRPDLRLPI